MKIEEKSGSNESSSCLVIVGKEKGGDWSRMYFSLCAGAEEYLIT